MLTSQFTAAENTNSHKMLGMPAMLNTAKNLDHTKNLD